MVSMDALLFSVVPSIGVADSSVLMVMDLTLWCCFISIAACEVEICARSGLPGEKELGGDTPTYGEYWFPKYCAF
uniref:Putative secreted protein n=1 Tax=Anopheles marajoara TaxID=58244 RepID=A0A2M4CD95_9DIPT